MSRTSRQPASSGGPSRRRWILASIIAAGVLALPLLGWLSAGWWLKPVLEQRVTQATGRAFSIDGELRTLWQWPPAIAAEGLRLANADGAAAAYMLEIDRLELTLRPWAALRGRWHLPSATLERPRLRFERGDSDGWNWHGLDRADDDGPGRLRIDALRVSDGELVIDDARTATKLTLRFDSQPPSGDDLHPPLRIAGDGRYRDRGFELSGRVDSPLLLAGKRRPYRLDLHARAGATHAHARGSVGAQLQLDRFNVDLELRGASLAELYPLLGLALPPGPPYRVDGRLSRNGGVWRYRGFGGTLGDSDLGGDVRVDVGGERPRFVADLRSRHLDLDDLAGLVGGLPDPDETASPSQQREAARRAARGRLLPEQEYDLDRLNAMDADVRLQAASIDAGRLPLDALVGHLVLEDGVATVDPLRFEIAGGRIDGRVRLDARNDPMAAHASGGVRGLQLPKLFPRSELVADSSGRIGGRLQVDGHGNSIADVLGNGNGELVLLLGSGRISNMLLELAGLDFAEALLLLVGRDREIGIRCGYADFALTDGRLEPRALAFDTTDTLILGSGHIDLDAERLDLELHARPKDRSLFALRSPLRLEGPLHAPDIGPKPGPLLLRGAAAVVLGSIAPPAALLALVETGPGEDINCSGLAAGTGRGTLADNADGDDTPEADGD